MAKYYNRSPGSLALTLKGGRAATLPGKAWTEISAEDEGSEDVIRALKRGLLTRFDLEPVAAPPSVVEVVTALPAEAVVAESDTLAAEPAAVETGVELEESAEKAVSEVSSSRRKKW